MNKRNLENFSEENVDFSNGPDEKKWRETYTLSKSIIDTNKDDELIFTDLTGQENAEYYEKMKEDKLLFKKKMWVKMIENGTTLTSQALEMLRKCETQDSEKCKVYKEILKIYERNQATGTIPMDIGGKKMRRKTGKNKKTKKTRKTRKTKKTTGKIKKGVITRKRHKK